MHRMLVIALAFVALSGCLSSEGSDAATDPEPTALSPLQFREPVELGSKAGPMGLGLAAFGTSCQDSLDDGDCGLGEPTLEVDGRGTIYISGVCCLTVSPPVLVSRDGGDSFQSLDTPTGVREAFGVEGDFAIDPEGNVYFADIEIAATFQVTAWDADGNFIHHTKWPAPPLVDRDWIRAMGPGELYYVYNTGSATNVYSSSNGGQAWSPVADWSTGYPLGNAASHPDHGFCVVGGNFNGFRQASCSETFQAPPRTFETLMPVGTDNFVVPVMDEVGTVFMVDVLDGKPILGATSIDGEEQVEAFRLPVAGTHRLPWGAAGAEDHLALAWYGTPDEEVTSTSQWFLYVAAGTLCTPPTTGCTSQFQVTRPDPTPVFTGVLQRELLDFLQVDLGPDGAIHVGYSSLGGSQGPDGNEEQLRYVRSEPTSLGAKAFPWGP